ncbi:hypothetical protein ACFX1Q_025150 [Malus domestica]
MCSSRSKVPVWPFLILSCFGGPYALLPYFVLWRPPPPPVDESELTRRPLNFLGSKLTAWERNFSLPVHTQLSGRYRLASDGNIQPILQFDISCISLAAGLGLIVSAGLAAGADWKEYYQYFNESKFIHATSLDFTLLSAFAPFWVYSDMTARKWFDDGSWLLFLSLVPLVGPALYLVLRPSLPTENVT